MRLIDADALKETIELEEGIFWDSYSPNELVISKKYIDNAPTVEARPKGKWIKEDEPFGNDFILVNTCSMCGTGYIYHGTNENYCPNCGAEMEADND